MFEISAFFSYYTLIKYTKDTSIIVKDFAFKFLDVLSSNLPLNYMSFFYDQNLTMIMMENKKKLKG